MADEVELGPLIGVVSQVGGHLLHPVLSAHLHAGGDGLPDGLGGLDLGGSHQGDLTQVPPYFSGRGGNVLLYLPDLFCQ